jgi:lipoate-protein ligase A
MLRAVLARRGAPARLCTTEEKRGEVLCFLHHTPGDLLLAGHKIAGSAQRRRHGALLQHGGLLLAQSPFTPALPGAAELANLTLAADVLAAELAAELAADTGWALHPSAWSDPETAAIPLLAERYASPSWNLRR